MRSGRSEWLIGVAVLLACALGAAPASAAPVPVWQPGLVAQVPSGGSNPQLSSVSCRTSGNCSAVGDFDINGTTQGLLVSQDAGNWEPGEQAKLPTGTQSDPDVQLSSVSCSSGGNCSAIGSYYDSNGVAQGLLLTETNGIWGTGVEAQLPDGSEGAVLESVSCAAAGDCSAVGYYVDSSDVFHAIVIDETNDTWGPAQDGSVPTGRAGLSSVSCWSVGNCTAVGHYVDGTGEEGIELTETDGQWGTGLETQPPGNVDPTGVPFPGHGGIEGHVSLNNVSCTASGECSAAGNYYDTNGVLEGMVEDQVGGTWQQAAEVNLPSDASNLTGGFPPPSRGVLNAISCASPGNCGAAGWFAESGGDAALVVSESAGVWSDGAEVTLPSKFSSTPNADLTSISCPATGECVAAGDYEATASEDFAELFVSQDGGTWQAGVSPALAAGSTASLGGQSVSCSAPGACGAADMNGNLFTALAPGTPTPTPTAAAPTLTLSAPRRGSLGKSSSAAATLSGGSSPTGRITFRVFGPEGGPPTGCLYGGRIVGTATVSGNGTYRPSEALVPRKPGKYWWYATYSGDGANHSVASDCGGRLTATTIVRKPSVTVRWVRAFGHEVRLTLVCDSARCRIRVQLKTGHLSSGARSTLSAGQHEQLELALHGFRGPRRAVLIVTANGRQVTRRTLTLR